MKEIPSELNPISSAHMNTELTTIDKTSSPEAGKRWAYQFVLQTIELYAKDRGTMVTVQMTKTRNGGYLECLFNDNYGEYLPLNFEDVFFDKMTHALTPLKGHFTAWGMGVGLEVEQTLRVGTGPRRWKHRCRVTFIQNHQHN